MRYHQLLQSRLMCLLHTEDMFLLKQMRKNLKTKIRAIVDKLGPEVFPEDFHTRRVVKKLGDNLQRKNSGASDRSVHRSGSFLSTGGAS